MNEKYYNGTEKVCPKCGGKIKHPYTGHVTIDQLDEDFNCCLWEEIIDEGRSAVGYAPLCKKEWRFDES